MTQFGSCKVSSRSICPAFESDWLVCGDEWVLARMIEAYEVLARTPMQTKPATAKGFWPATVREWSDLQDVEAFQRERATFFDGRRDRIEADEASRMNEALAWPMQHLQGCELDADALTLFASCEAAERDLTPILRKRRVKARKLAILQGLKSEFDYEPGFIFTSRALTVHRRQACGKIAIALDRANITVR